MYYLLFVGLVEFDSSEFSSSDWDGEVKFYSRDADGYEKIILSLDNENLDNMRQILPEIKNIVCATLIILCIQLSANAQFFSNTVIKTRPLKDLIALNPNLSFEKPIHKIITAEFEFTYKHRSWESSGREWDFGKFYNSDGFKLLVGSRVYFGRTNKHLQAEKQKAPLGWFAALQLGYTNFKIHNVEIYSFHGDYMHNVSVTKRMTELNVLLGRQFYLSQHFTLELYLGISNYLDYYEKTRIIISDIPQEIGETTIRNYTSSSMVPNLGISLGYRF